MFSVVHSKIKWLTLFFDGDDVSIWIELLKSLVTSLPPKTQILICCSEQNHLDILWENTLIWAKGQHVKKTEIGQILQKAKCYLHLVPQANEFVSIWCRDPFFFKFKPSNPEIIYFSKTGYASNNDFARLNWGQLDSLNCQIKESDAAQLGKPLYLSGGNFLADEDFILVGYLEFKRTWLPTNDAQSTFIHTLKTEQEALNTLLSWANEDNNRPFEKVHLVGKGVSFPKPSSFLGDKVFAHIDCYISLTNSYKMEASGEKKYVLLVARIEQLFMPLSVPQTDWHNTISTWNDCLDAVAQQLEGTGNFAILRNPIPAFVLCDWDLDKAQPRPLRPYLGLMNNVLTEITASTKTIWLPALKPALYLTDANDTLAKIEQDNRRLWTSLGFEVRVINTNFHPFWKWLGGLRCLTNQF
jgi:hypothetical protein